MSAREAAMQCDVQMSGGSCGLVHRLTCNDSVHMGKESVSRMPANRPCAD